MDLLTVGISGSSLLLAGISLLINLLKNNKDSVKDLSDLQIKVAVLEERVENETELLKEVQADVKEVIKCL